MRAKCLALILLLAVGCWAPSQSHSRPDHPKRLRLGSWEMERLLLKRVEPNYPPLAEKAHIRGLVQLEVLIGTDGRVRETRVISGHPLLVQAALDAVKQWRYEPLRWQDELVEVITTVELRFPPAKPKKGQPQLRPV